MTGVVSGMHRRLIGGHSEHMRLYPPSLCLSIASPLGKTIDELRKQSFSGEMGESLVHLARILLDTPFAIW